MDTFDVARDSLAVVGVGGLAYALFSLFRGRPLAEDAPIRVKGGSVVVENDEYDWVPDSEDGKQYHFKGRSASWKVEVWKKESDVGVTKPWTKSGRRAFVFVEAGNDFELRFRANGGVRVIDNEGRMTASGKRLTFPHESLIVKVVVKEGGDTHEFTDFGGEKGFILLTPM